MKIIKITFLALILILQSNYSSIAQRNENTTPAIVSGKLLDQSQEEIMYASVALLDADSTVITGEISSEIGVFKIPIANSGTYFLRVEHLEYQTYISQPFMVSPGESKILPDLILQNQVNSLGEVVVVHKKEMIEVKADKLIFNVADSPSASGTNGLDLLKKSPGVTLDMDNNIALLGKAGVQVYINGIPSRLSGNDLTIFLQSMASDNIQFIEIITNPSAKYEAEGNAGIINIRMKKNSATGFNGSATSSFTQGRYLRYNNSLRLNYGGEKLKANFEFTQSQNKSFDTFLDTKAQNDAILDLDSEEIEDRKGINVALGMEARLSKDQTLNLSGRSVFNQRNNVLTSQTDIYNIDPKQLSSVLLSNSFAELFSANHTYNLNHQWRLNSTSSWNTALSVGTYENERNTQQPNTFLEADGTTVDIIDDREFDADTQIKLWSAKTDYEKTWENATFSAGAKYSHIATENSFEFYNIENQTAAFDPTRSNDFKYTEKVTALYGMLNLKLGNSLRLDAGLRIENTNSRGQLFSEIETDNKDVPRNYTDFFPSVGLSFDNQKDHTWGLSIGRRITRPNYQDLNPFETPISQLTVWKGNPFLRPKYTMNYQASYAYKKKLIVTNTYSVTKDFFANIFEITGENGNQIIPRNMEKATSYGVSVSYPVTVNEHWDFITFANAAYRTFEGNLEGTIIDITAKTWDFRWQNNINLPWGIKLDLTYYIGSDWVWRGSINVKGNQDIGFGLRKDFLDKRLQIRITGSDIFRTTNDYFYQGNYGGIEIDGVRSFDTQRFGLGATYKFGNLQAKTRRNNKNALEDELNRIEN